MATSTPTLARTIARYIREREARGELSKASVKHYRDVLRRFERFIGPERELTSIRRHDMLKWMEYNAQHPAATRRTYWARTASFIAWCLEEGLIERDPRRGIKRPSVPRAVHRSLDHQQIKALFAACQNDRDRLLLVLGLQLGLRCGEIARLEVGDVAWGMRSIIVKGKGGHERELPVTDEVKRALQRYLSSTELYAGPLFPSPAHPGPVVAETVGRWWAAIAWRAGVKARPWDGIGSHAARHTAATDVYRGSKDPLAVQQMLGHASLATTQGYVRGSDMDALLEAMRGRSYSSTGA